MLARIEDDETLTSTPCYLWKLPSRQLKQRRLIVLAKSAPGLVWQSTGLSHYSGIHSSLLEHVARSSHAEQTGPYHKLPQIFFLFLLGIDDCILPTFLFCPRPYRRATPHGPSPSLSCYLTATLTTITTITTASILHQPTI